MTDEQKKEIEADAEKTAQDVSSDPSDQNMFYCGYIAGATAEAEKKEANHHEEIKLLGSQIIALTSSHVILDNLLYQVNDLLAYLEDTAHGKDGKRITDLRGRINKYYQNLT